MSRCRSSNLADNGIETIYWVVRLVGGTSLIDKAVTAALARSTWLKWRQGTARNYALSTEFSHTCFTPESVIVAMGNDHYGEVSWALAQLFRMYKRKAVLRTRKLRCRHSKRY